MNQPLIATTLFNKTTQSIRYLFIVRSLLTGLLIPLGFSPFHLPGLAIVSLALLFIQLRDKTSKQSFFIGFFFGLGFLSLGVSWVHVSIHQYGHLNIILSAFITFIFISYLAIFPALAALCYQKIALKNKLNCTQCVIASSRLFNCFLFSSLWCLSEFLRANVMGGFPWLLIGFGQIDTPLRYFLPLFGVYGVSFIACFAATLLACGMKATRSKRYFWIIPFIILMVSPSLLKSIQWTSIRSTPISVGVIQANLSMRDKWDESLFWALLEQYQRYIEQLVGKKQIIVMPESAIPVPINYVSDFLDNLDHQANQNKSAILLGIPQPTSVDSSAYYNTLTTLGSAQGRYLKQHLVPFGEFIPKPFQAISDWLALPVANLKSGHHHQSLITVHDHPVATLICYELAYPNLLRLQLPQAEWIVSISDDGWFGHSLAMHQQLQMAQVLSLQTGRFQIVANNDGLSSIINSDGQIISSLPAFSSGILESEITPATGATPWVRFGDRPVLMVSMLITVCFFGSSCYLRRRRSIQTEKIDLATI